MYEAVLGKEEEKGENTTTTQEANIVLLPKKTSMTSIGEGRRDLTHLRQKEGTEKNGPGAKCL